MAQNQSPLPAIVGPTAAGKTALALRLAERHPIEVVSADSMQVYRDLNVGTAKPAAAERRAVPHHLIDVAAPDERYDLARFLDEAGAAIDDIQRRGRFPLIVGGAGLYIKGLSEGIFTAPSRDPSVRAALETRIASEGAPPLHAELARVDPEAAQRISPHDAIRIVRALEVFQVSGRPISEWHADPRAPATPARPLRVIVLDRPRPSLHARIEARARAMLDAGWIEETRALLQRGLSPEAHCFKALGYRPIIRALAGEIPFDSLPERIALETRQFAKRQITWFRAMPAATWIDLDRVGEEDALEALEKAYFS